MENKDSAVILASQRAQKCVQNDFSRDFKIFENFFHQIIVVDTDIADANLAYLRDRHHMGFHLVPLEVDSVA